MTMTISRRALGRVLGVTAGALVLGAWAAPARADEIHLRNGKVLEGRLQEQTRSGYSFLEVDGRRPKTVKNKDVERVVLTYSLPEWVYTDPQWSGQMVADRLESDCDPEWGEMEVLRSDHYIVFTNSSAGKKYLKTMEDIYDRFIKLFPFEEPENARLMPVFLFKTPDQYWEFYVHIADATMEKARKSAGHAWRDYYATYYDAPAAPTHYHEGAHQLVKNRLLIGGGGSWFQEGMAVYFEGTVFPGEDPTMGMKSMVKSGQHTPLPELFELRSLLQSTDTTRDTGAASRNYQQAGAVLVFLKEGPYADRFDAFLDALREGASAKSAALAVFGATSEDLEEQFREFYD